jgi:hypothetical protein
METFDFGDGLGSVPATRHKNPDGSLGGWVAATAQVSGTAWVSGNAQVSGPYCKATRSDGHEFAVFKTSKGFCIVAGCRYFESWEDAETYWLAPPHPLRRENRAILNMLKAISE